MEQRRTARLAAASQGNAAREAQERTDELARARLKRATERVASRIEPAAVSAISTGDGRRAPRKSSLIGGTITAASMVAERPCKIMDMSATGARLKLMPTSDGLRGLPAGVPDSFTLVLRVDRIEVDCEVAWRADRELGVKFKAVPRALTAVRR